MARQLVVLQLKNGYVVPELLYLGQALERNWETFSSKMQYAVDKNHIVSSDLRALQDSFVLLWHKQGAFIFKSAEDARDYTRNIYALMTKAQMHLPPEITESKTEHYVAYSTEALASGVLTLDGVDDYRNQLQRWAPKLWVAFVALTIAGAGGAALSLGLLAGGWPIALVATAVVAWALLTLREKWDGSLSRTDTFADMLARNVSGLYRGMKKTSWTNVAPSVFLVGLVGLAVFAPAIGMIASGLAVFGLVTFMALSVVANGFHNNASLFNAGRKFMEKYLKWFQFGYSKLSEEALPDLQKIQKTSEMDPIGLNEGSPDVQKIVEMNNVVSDHVDFMSHHGKLIKTSVDRKQVIHDFETEAYCPDIFKTFLMSKKDYSVLALEALSESVLDLSSDRAEHITVKPYQSRRVLANAI